MLRGTKTHPKFAAVQQAWGCGTNETIGRLESLWHFTAEYAPRGDIGRWTNKEIAAGCHIDKRIDAFVQALVDSGWLDPCEEYRLVVHDWSQHCDRATKARVKRRGLGFVECNGTHEHCQGRQVQAELVVRMEPPPPDPEPEPMVPGDSEGARLPKKEYVKEAWNKLAKRHDVPTIRAVTDTMRRQVSLREKEFGGRDELWGEIAMGLDDRSDFIRTRREPTFAKIFASEEAMRRFLDGEKYRGGTRGRIDRPVHSERGQGGGKSDLDAWAEQQGAL